MAPNPCKPLKATPWCPERIKTKREDRTCRTVISIGKWRKNWVDQKVLPTNRPLYNQSIKKSECNRPTARSTNRNLKWTDEIETQLGLEIDRLYCPIQLGIETVSEDRSVVPSKGSVQGTSHTEQAPMFPGPEERFKELGSMFQEEETIGGNSRDRRRDTWNQAASSRDQRRANVRNRQHVLGKRGQ